MAHFASPGRRRVDENAVMDRCGDAKTIRRIDAAFRAGDLEALLEAVDDPSVVPNRQMPAAIGPCLVCAIYHSPVAFVRMLLEMGADPNPPALDGFPPLIAAIAAGRPTP